jgi:hypothetical protein
MRVTLPTYYDESVDTAYPFDPSATRTNGQVAIENDVFIDGRLYPPGGRHDLFIASIEVGEQVTISLSDGRGALGSGSFTRNAPPSWVDFFADGEIYLGCLLGYPVGDRGLSKLAGWPDGTYTFQMPQTRFAATVVVPQPQACVRTVRLESGEIFHGDVPLVGENGVQLTVVNQDGSSSSLGGQFGVWHGWEEIIRVDVVGDPLFVRRDCEAEGAPVERDRLLKTIQFDEENIGPHGSGTVQLLVGYIENYAQEPALRVVPIPNGIRMFFFGEG